MSTSKYMMLLGRLYDASMRLHPITAAGLGIRFHRWAIANGWDV